MNNIDTLFFTKYAYISNRFVKVFCTMKNETVYKSTVGIFTQLTFKAVYLTRPKQVDHNRKTYVGNDCP